MTVLKTFKVVIWDSIFITVNQVRDNKTGEIFYQNDALPSDAAKITSDAFWSLEPKIID